MDQKYFWLLATVILAIISYSLLKYSSIKNNHRALVIGMLLLALVGYTIYRLFGYGTFSVLYALEAISVILGIVVIDTMAFHDTLTIYQKIGIIISIIAVILLNIK